MGDSDTLQEHERLIARQRASVRSLAQRAGRVMESNDRLVGTQTGASLAGREMRDYEVLVLAELRQALHDLDAMQRGEFDSAAENPA